MLTADKKFIWNGLTVYEYLLTSHNPNGIDLPYDHLPSKISGITVHNTEDLDNVNDDGEQYTRATVNGNMGSVRVHFYVDDVCAWQDLPLYLSSWHAGDGDGPGNGTTISIECIMNSSSNSMSLKAEDNCAKLVAYLLNKYGLTVKNNLFTHTHWINVMYGRKGNNDYLNTTPYPGEKYCPYYILPHWNEFKKKVQNYLDKLKKGTSTNSSKNTSTESKSTDVIYRIRKSKDDAASQKGAYKNLESAKKECPVGYSVYDQNGKEVYSNKPKTESSTKSSGIKAGNSIKLSNVDIYSSSSANTSSGKKTGTFYIYDNEVVNNRVKITNSKSNVGKTPTGSYVTGWIDTKNISGFTSKTATKSYAKGTKLNLKNVTLYANASASSGVKISGTYWLYDGENVSGRYRITNAQSNVGKTPIGFYVTGFINKSDI